jgi:hypothetical protein
LNRNEFTTVALAVFGAWIAAILALLQLDWHWLANAIIILWITASLAAFIVLQDEPRRTAIARYLENPGYNRQYLRLVTPVANLPRDWRCYDWALRLAVLYPILSMVLLWAWTGKAGTFGSVQFLPAHDSWIVTVAAICSLALALSGRVLENWAAASPKVVLRRVSDWLPVAAPAIAGAFASLAAFAIAGSFAAAAATAVATAFAAAAAGASAAALSVAIAVGGASVSLAAFAFAGGGASLAPLGAALGAAIAFAIAFAIAVPIAVRLFVNRARGTLGYILFTALIALTLFAALTLLPWAETNDESRAMFLFFGLLPIVNALTDYASYAVTIWLVQQGLKTTGWAFLMSLLDIIAALLLLTLLGVLLILVIAWANALAGVPLFPLAPLFAGLRQDPVAYLWVYAMLFSTLVPTLVHLVVGVFSMIALPFFALIDVPLSRWIKRPDHATAVLSPVLLGTAVTVSILLPCLLAYNLYLGAAYFWPDIAQGYLELFESLARWLETA